MHYKKYTDYQVLFSSCGNAGLKVYRLCFVYSANLLQSILCFHSMLTYISWSCVSYHRVIMIYFCQH